MRPGDPQNRCTKLELKVIADVLRVVQNEQVEAQIGFAMGEMFN